MLNWRANWTALSAVMLLAGTGAVAQTAPSALPGLTTETVATFLGMNLPLRPGERVIPIGDGSCSVVEFVPDPALHTQRIAYWRERSWQGACRFGLAHGEGVDVFVSRNEAANETTIMRSPRFYLYGTHFGLVRRTFEYSADGESPTTMVLGVVYKGRYASDLSAEVFTYHNSWTPNPVQNFAELLTDMRKTSELTRQYYDADGAERLILVGMENIDKWCGRALSPQLLRFAKKIAAACKESPDDRTAIVRREGLSRTIQDDSTLVSLAPCLYFMSEGKTSCAVHYRIAAGSLASEFDQAAAGDRASRTAMTQEIIARFAPLERALAERLAAIGGSK